MHTQKDNEKIYFWPRVAEGAQYLDALCGIGVAI